MGRKTFRSTAATCRAAQALGSSDRAKPPSGGEALDQA